MATGNTSLGNNLTSNTSKYSHALGDLRKLLGTEKTQGPSDIAGELNTPHPTNFRFGLQAQAIVPACRALPTTAEDVSVILKYCKENNVPFAIKSGGHGTYAAASSIDSVVIDFSHLNTVEIASDKKSVLVGSGARWGQVYKILEKEGLACVGGRVTGVGVGGLLLGGGISFFSSKRGLGCDNVRTYTVVLASGDIVKVNRDSYQDLSWALRGAGANMCIAVQFKLETFEQGKMWGGGKVVSSPNKPLLPALDKFCADASDLDAEIFIITAYMAETDSFASIITFTYSKPEAAPAVWKPFEKIPGVFTTLRIASLLELTDELEGVNPTAVRCKTHPIAVKSNADLLEEIVNIFKDEVEPIKRLKDFKRAILFQPLIPAMLPTDDIVVTLIITWADAEHDEMILKATDNIISRSAAAAKAKDLFHPYVPLNYASRVQDVYGSYGEENRKRLLGISKKYDPEQVFPRLRPGSIQLQA